MKKQTHRRLLGKDNQFLLDEIQRLAHLGYWKLDLPANRMVWSAEVSRIFGLDPQENQTTYEDFLTVIHLEDRATVDAAYRASVLEKRNEFEIEHRIIQSGSGEIRYVYQKCVHERDRQGAIVRSTGIVQDITERKRMENALRENEVRHQQLAENISDVVWTADLSFNTTYISPSIQKLTGDTPERYISRSLEERHPPAAIEVFKQVFAEETQKDSLPGVNKARTRILEVEHYTTAGAIIWTAIHLSFLRDSLGNITGIIGVTRDITARKQAEEALQESEKRYRLLAENASDVIWTMDLNLRSTYTSPAVKRLRGYEPEEAVRQPLEVALTPASFEIVSRVLSEELAAEKRPGQDLHRSRTLELEAIRKDGSTVWTEAIVTFLRDRNGQPVEILGVTRDITERKRAEETLQWQARFQRLLMDISLTYINLPPAEVSAEVDNSLAELGAFVGADRAYIFTYDFPAQICINTHEWCAEGIMPQMARLQAVPLETAPDWVAAHTQGQPFYIPDVSALPPGGVKDFLATQDILGLLTVPMMDGAACVGFIGFDSVRQPRHYSDDEQRLLKVFAELLVNVHRRQQAEQALEVALTKYKTLFETFPLGISVTDETGRILETNATAEKLLAVPQDEHTQRDIDSPTWRLIREDGTPMPPEEYVSVQALKEKHLVENVRMGILKPDETVTWLNVTAAPLPMPGYGVVITYGDITAQLRAEQALHENNQFITSLLRAIPVAVFFKDWEGRYLGCNDVFSEIMGVSAETIRGKTVYELWPGELARTYHEKDLELMRNRQHQTYEFQVKDKDGQIRPVIFAKDVFLDASGQPAGMVGAFIDITERKHMENQMRVKEWAISDSINAIALADLGGNLTFANPAFLSLWGYPSDAEVLGKGSVEFWQSREEAADVMTTLRQEGHWRGELLGKRRDGSRFIAEVSASLVLDESKRPLSLLGVFEDITGRKQAEAELHRSLDRNRAMLTAQPDLLFVIDSNLVFLEAFANDPTRLLLPPEQVIGRPVSELLPPYLADLTAEKVRLTLQTGQMQIYDYPLALGGEELFFEARMTPLNPESVLVLIRDMTEMHRAEQALRESEQRYRSLFMTEQRQAQELELLHRARTAIASQMDLSDIFRTTVEAIGHTFGYTLVSLYLLEGSLEAGTGILTLQHAIGYDRIISQIPTLKGISGRVTRNGQPVLIQDVRADPDFLEAVAGIVSEICIPLIDQGRVVGTLNIESQQELTEGDLRLMVALTEHVNIAIGRARLYEASRESERKYRRLSSLLRLMADTMPDMLWAKNTNKEFIFVNQAICENLLIAADTEEPLGKTDMFFASRERQDHLEDPHWHTFGELCQDSDTIILEELKPMQFDEFGNVKGKFLYLDVHKAPMYDEDGQLIGIVGSARDVTARKQAETALRGSESRYRALFEQSNDAIFLEDPETDRIIDANRRAAELMGYSREQLLEMQVSNLQAPEVRRNVSGVLREEISQYGNRTFEGMNLHADGHRIPVEITNTWLTDQGTALILSIMRDITERKRVEEVKKLNAERLEALVALNNMTGANESELTHFAMETAVRLTGSTIGYIAFMNEDETALSMYAWSTQAMRECAIVDRPIVYPVASTGLWGEAVRQRKAIITNDYAAPNPRKKGMPDGHVHVTRHMNAPTFDGSRIVILAGVGNKPTDYGDDDVRQLSLLMSGLWSIVRRKRAEEELRHRFSELEAVNHVSTALRTAQTSDEMLSRLMDETLKALESKVGGILLYQPEDEELHNVVMRGWFEELKGISHKLGQGIAGTVFASGQAYISHEFASDPLVHPASVDRIPKGWGGICVPIRTADEVAGVMFVSMLLPCEITSDQAKLLTTLAEMAGTALHRLRLHEQTHMAAAELALAYDTTLEGWAGALELRDQETVGHTRRVVEGTIELARMMEVSEAELENIRRGALLHDIGKMGIPDSVLLKPGTLDEREWEIMRRHPEYAFNLLKQIEYLYSALNIPYCHHEKWDGSGYPRGLKGDEIPLEARIFAVVDVWDALTNNRPYRPAWSNDKALEYIRQQSGKHFDPNIANHFLDMILGGG